MQTGNLTFELAAAVALLVGSKQLVYKQSYRAITNPKLPHKKASQGKQSRLYQHVISVTNHSRNVPFFSVLY